MARAESQSSLWGRSTNGGSSVLVRHSVLMEFHRCWTDEASIENTESTGKYFGNICSRRLHKKDTWSDQSGDRGYFEHCEEVHCYNG